MRTLSPGELKLLVGGYGSSAAEQLTNADIDALAQPAQSMNDSDAATYAVQQAASFGVNIGGATVTPIFNPFSGPNSIRYGVRVRVGC